MTQVSTQVTHTLSHGQDDGDAWYDSSYNNTIHTPWPADEKSCQSCHMPRVQASQRERGAKNGWADHRFLGANSALARLDNRVHQVSEISEFLKGRIQLSLMQSLAGTVDVVLFNAAVGHRFPGGVNDSNEVWLEIEMRDEAGHLVGEHGTHTDGARDRHLIRAQPVDSAGMPIALRDVQNLHGVVYDTSVPSRGVRLVRYTLAPGTQSVTARVKLSQFDRRYADFACAQMPASPRRERCLTPPTHTIADVHASMDTLNAKTTYRIDEALRYGWALMDGTAQDIQLGLNEVMAVLRKNPENSVAQMLKAFGESRLGRTDQVEDTLGALVARGSLPNFGLRILIESRGRAFRHALALEAAEMLLERLPEDRIALGFAARFRQVSGDMRAH